MKTGARPATTRPKAHGLTNPIKLDDFSCTDCAFGLSRRLDLFRRITKWLSAEPENAFCAHRRTSHRCVFRGVRHNLWHDETDDET